jgi:hypothetical protein
MKRILAPVLCAFLLMGASPRLRADEGMWLPILLGANEADMQAMGMKMTAADIYSVNRSSLKDAIVRFGGGCTGEIVSAEGLLLTNHHCGFSQILRHSSLEKDYLKQGFWAQSRAEELSNPGLKVSFIVRMEDVTTRVLGGIEASMAEEARQSLIRARMDEVVAEATKGTHYEAEVKPFYYGNEYYLIVMETFRDVRLVGAPPSAIGNFGGETDNWVWPRHTADFSVFRVYAGPDGKPADYSPENQPLRPRHFLPISMRGVQEGEFTLVFGFPGRTQEYLSSYGVQLALDVQDPLRIDLRAQRLAVYDAAMAGSDLIRLQYADKAKGIANAYKKWQGEVRGLRLARAVEKKQAFEAELMKRAAAQPEWQSAYGWLLDSLGRAYQALTHLAREVEVFAEGGLGIELVAFTARAARYVQAYEKAASPEDKQKTLAELRSYAAGFYKAYQPQLDEAVAEAMLASYQRLLPAERLPEPVRAAGGQHKAYAQRLFSQSLLPDSARFYAWMASPDPKRFYEDPAFALMSGIYARYYEVQPAYQALNNRIEGWQRSWMQAQRTMFPEKRFYPDANLTLRATYGRMEGMKPADGVEYLSYTTLDGVMQKHQPGNPDFEVPERLRELYEARDFGPYAQNGSIRTCFIASNHTSGGNSGSPVINGEGHLVGINFDRGWEGTMSDINYDVRLCRNISVDIRYVLFIIDKYAGAGYLVEEMKLIP